MTELTLQDMFYAVRDLGDRMEKRFAEQSAGSAEQAAQIDNLAAQVSGVEGQILRIEGRLDGIDHRLSDQTAILTKLIPQPLAAVDRRRGSKSS